jgi:zinc D-Ala-D-Ala carboxypeptidase
MRYFKLTEFASPDELGSEKKMKQSFLQMIDRARASSGVPYKITSGYRTESHNKAIGGSPTSSHLKGWAADIECANSNQRERILFGLVVAGFHRIGIAKTFIHCDCDPAKPDAVWLYD